MKSRVVTVIALVKFTNFSDAHQYDERGFFAELVGGSMLSVDSRFADSRTLGQIEQ